MSFQVIHSLLPIAVLRRAYLDIDRALCAITSRLHIFPKRTFTSVRTIINSTGRWVCLITVWHQFSGRPMKRFILCLTLIANSALAQGTVSPMKEIKILSNDKFITTNNGASIEEAYKNADLWNGRSVSIEGVIEAVWKNSRGQSSIDLLLDGSANTKIRIVSALNLEKGYFSTVGERIKIMGWLYKTTQWTPRFPEESFGENPLLLLSICFIHVKSNDQLLDKTYLEFCDAWGQKYLPPDMETK